MHDVSEAPRVVQFDVVQPMGLYYNQSASYKSFEVPLCAGNWGCNSNSLS